VGDDVGSTHARGVRWGPKTAVAVGVRLSGRALVAATPMSGVSVGTAVGSDRDAGVSVGTTAGVGGTDLDGDGEGSDGAEAPEVARGPGAGLC
jgi:hypothetical protein